MNTILKILLLLTASSCALALCDKKCNETYPCEDIVSCLKNECSVTEEDLPDKCKCHVKCQEELEAVRVIKNDCLLLQTLQTCFKKNGNCDASNVPELQNFEQNCTVCEPKQCNKTKCGFQLICLTRSSDGACRSAAAVQTVLNSTSQDMHNAWFLPEKCDCYAKCAAQVVRFTGSCRSLELLKRCTFDNKCSINISKNILPCDCNYACSSQLNKALIIERNATSMDEKCKAKKSFNECAANFGCGNRPASIQNIDCSVPRNGSPFFGSNLLAAFIVTTILAAFITTNLFMA